MTAYIALIRHGDYHQLDNTPSAHQPRPLNEQGKQQAVAAVSVIKALAKQHECQLIPSIDSSSLLRAWQTADILSRGLGQGEQGYVEAFADLAERSVGAVANMSLSQIETALEQDPRYSTPPANWKSDSHFRLPFIGAESLLQAGDRVARHIRRRVTELHRLPHARPLKLFVGHGAAFRHAAYHLGVLDFDDIAGLSMYHCAPIILKYHDNGECEHIDGQWKCRDLSAPLLD